jgi:hypothetical protein
MAVALEFIDLIVRIDAIRAHYPGGIERCLYDHVGNIDGRVWYYEHLFRDGAMSPRDITSLVEWWESVGLVGLTIVDGVEKWQDFCVVERLFGGATRRCDWLVIDQRQAYLRGTEPGELACSGSMEAERNRILASLQAL